MATAAMSVAAEVGECAINNDSMRTASHFQCPDHQGKFDSEASYPSKAAAPTTVFGAIAYCAAEASQDERIDMATFLKACKAYREFLTKFGVMQFFILDFDENYGRVQDFYQGDQAHRSTLADFCMTKGQPQEKTSWLLRGMDFFVTVLQKVWDGDKDAGRTAYELTLSRHHTRTQRWMSKAFLSFLPTSKDAVCSAVDLVLAPIESGCHRELIDREAMQALQLFAPMLRSAIAINAAATGALP